MNRVVDAAVVELIRSLYLKDTFARKFFDRASERANDVAETNVERVALMAGGTLSRKQAVDLARAICDAGCGQFIIGRKGGKSRIHWKYSIKSVGDAARGRTESLNKLDPDVQADADGVKNSYEIISPPFEAKDPLKLTISEAKNALALSLGVSPNAIEITIKG